jgi:hypothetical protein
MAETFLPALFGDDMTDDVPRCSFPIKKCGLGNPNPTERADTSWTASMVFCGHLILAIQG